jgi:hypothetical protein
MGLEPKPAAVRAPEANLDAFGEDLSELPSRPSLTGLTPVDSPVHSQQAEIAGRLSSFAPDDAGEEEADETAELYEPEDESFQASAAPVVHVAPVAKAAVVARRAPVSRAAPGAKGKAAFTLRLDRERHLKLRLASAVSGQSAQILVTQALDQMLAAMPELDAMAGAKPKG